jgi:DNA processing protein
MTVPEYLRARAYLLRVTEPPASAVHDFVVAHGPVEAVARIREGRAPDAVFGAIRRHAAAVDPDADQAVTEAVNADLALIESGDARLVTPESDQWPTGLLRALSVHGYGVPLGLWVRGTASLTDITGRAVSIAGARAATSYGQHVATDFGHGLARAEITVVTGGSYGVDAAALRGALAADGPTVAVLGSGVNLAHPRGHQDLFTELVDQGGLLISEHPPTAAATRTRLAVRNRIIAALATVTVVTEAGARGGALATARTAQSLGRRVFAVPGPVTSTMSTGTNELLRTGEASPVTSIETLINAARSR